MLLKKIKEFHKKLVQLIRQIGHLHSHARIAEPTRFKSRLVNDVIDFDLRLTFPKYHDSD